jgi:hypothetical protein
MSSGMSFIKGRATDNGPFHKLTETQTTIWVLGDKVRVRLIDALRKRYSSGVYVCNATLAVIGHVDSRGAVTEAAPPFQRVERWQLANQPAVKECPCAEFWDPEVRGPWRERGSNEHHPLCQYDPHVFRTFNKAAKVHLLPKAETQRPDFWLKVREEERAKTGG